MPLFDFKCDACGHEEKDRLVVHGNIPYRCSECKKTQEGKTTQFGMMQKQVSMPSRTSSRWGDTNSNKI